MDLSDDDLKQRAEVDRRAVDSPIQVESAMWSPGGQLDYWVKDRQEWCGRVRGADGKQRWIRAGDLRPANGSYATRTREPGNNARLSWPPETPGIISGNKADSGNGEDGQPFSLVTPTASA